MLVYSNTTLATPVGGGTYASNPAVLKGGLTYVFPWCATARDNTLAINSGGSIFDSATRTATTCYMRGLKERIQVQTNSGAPWQWRRICFTLKGDTLIEQVEDAYHLLFETSNGFQRVLNNVRSANMNAVINDILFKGIDGRDWNNYFNAKTDNTRCSIKYDKTFAIRCGNDSGYMKEFKLWHPMNKNLVYNDDEAGGDKVPGYYSVDSRLGMGDYYVIDIISAGSDANGDDQMTFNPQATLYWHEK